MAATAILRLDGPMQAWSRSPRTHGGQGRRPTDDHPTKTGVIGLVANILGRDRTDDIGDLTSLVFAVRADRPGTPAVDYHVVGGGDMPVLPGTILTEPGWVTKASKAPAAPTRFEDLGTIYAAPRDVKTNRDGVLSSGNNRATAPGTDEYLADAAFTVALTGDDTVVKAIAAAAQAPARIPHLGRVSYQPTADLFVTVTAHDDPVDALRDAPLAARPAAGPFTVWSQTLQGQVVQDQPVSYTTRQAVARREGITTVNPAPDQSGASSPHPTDTEWSYGFGRLGGGQSLLADIPDSPPEQDAPDMFAPPTQVGTSTGLPSQSTQPNDPPRDLGVPDMFTPEHP